LATEQDLARLEEIREATRPLERGVAWQLGVSLGIRPWFVETALRVPGREKAEEISSARVILATAAHTNAETSNHVYFQIGGRKYFLHPPGGRLTPDASPQGFELDLAAGPLAAGDLRGFALGMLAHDQPYATAPDRWHPERLLVELGGRLVYDSDSVPLDRRSLELIRLVPPAHVGRDGQILVNEPNPRECVVWRTGHGQGLDLENGGPAELPGGMSAIEPEPAGDQESGLVDLGGDWWPGEAPLDPGSFAEWSCEEDYDRPGSDTLADLGPPWEGSASGSAGSRRWCFWGSGFEAGWFWQPGWIGAFTGGGGSGMPWYGIPEVVIIRFRPEDPNQAAWARLATRLEELVAALLDALGRRPNVPLPIGEPPQIDNVHLVRDEANPRRFQVLWHVHGDRTQIERYEVSLWHIQPEMDDPLIADVTPPGQSTIPAVAGVADWASEWIELAEVNDRTAYIQPLVVAVLNDGSDETNWPIEVGAALPWLAPEADENNQPQPDWYSTHTINSALGHIELVTAPIRDVEPEQGQAGVWAARVLTTHRDISLDSTPGITSNVAVRAAPDLVTEATVEYVVRQPLDPALRYELIGHAGYLDWSASDSAAHVEVHYWVSPPGGAAGGAGPAQPELLAEFEVSRSEPPRLFTGTIDLSRFPEGGGPLRIRIRTPRGNDDPAAPLAFYGLRLLPIIP
jgi:hypothetical protein